MTAGMPPEGPPEMEANTAQPRRGWSWTFVGALAAIAVAAVFVFFNATFRPPRRAECLSRVKNIALAFQMYLVVDDDRFPPADGWCDRLEEYVMNREVFNCPYAGGPGGSHAYNASLDGVALADVADPSRTIAVFESDAGWNAAGGRELLPDEPRHSWGEEQGDHYGFADGSARWLPRKKLPDGTWAKEPDAEVIWEVGATEQQAAVPSMIHDAETGLVNGTYTVIRAFCVETWGWPRPDASFLLTGEKERVDTELGNWTFAEGGKGLPELPQGIESEVSGCVEWRYRDASGARLLAEDCISIDTLILTRRSPYEAQLVPLDFGALMSTSGVKLGDSRERVEKLLGTPSHVSEFGCYEILWYLRRPTHHAVQTAPDSPERPYDDGEAAAYALERDRVVEVWLHSWTTQALGG